MHMSTPRAHNRRHELHVTIMAGWVLNFPFFFLGGGGVNATPFSSEGGGGTIPRNAGGHTHCD